MQLGHQVRYWVDGSAITRDIPVGDPWSHLNEIERDYVTQHSQAWYDIPHSLDDCWDLGEQHSDDYGDSSMVYLGMHNADINIYKEEEDQSKIWIGYIEVPQHGWYLCMVRLNDWSALKYLSVSAYICAIEHTVKLTHYPIRYSIKELANGYGILS